MWRWNREIGGGTGVSGADRIAVYTAVRGTLVAAAPFLLLRHTGHPTEALFAPIAVLNICIADAGGPYLQRLVLMLAVAVFVPLILLAGMLCQGNWWLAASLMFAVALLGGLARLFGPGGTAVGLICSIVFLIGIEVPADLAHALRYAACFFASAAWSICVLLVVWRLRPYRRVRFELGEGFSRLAAMFQILRAVILRTDKAASGEVLLVAAQRQARASFESAEDMLGETVAATGSVPGFVFDLVVLLRAGMRITAAAASLGSTLEHGNGAIPSEQAHDAMDALLHAFEAACADLAGALLDRAEAHALETAGECLRRWESTAKPAVLEEADTLANVVLRQLEGAQRVTERLAEPRRGHGGLLPPLHGPAFPSVSAFTVRSNLNLGSLVFRHALRVAVTASGATAAYLLLRIPHGMWLPLTAIIVLQPQLGPTMTRAAHRTAGTVSGAALAGIMVFVFRGPAAMEGAVLGCLFMTLLFFRRLYWLAVAFLTPMIILLLSLLVHHPWLEIIERIGNTLGGSALALLAAMLLWPNREHNLFPEAVADAIDANRRYLAALFEAVAHGVEPDWPLADVRARAELATSNARDSLDRMLSEPRWLRRAARPAVATVTHLERMCRHLTRLSIYLHKGPGVLPDFGSLGGALNYSLADMAAAAKALRRPPEDTAIEQEYIRMRRHWQTGDPVRQRDLAPVDSLVGSIISDVQSLRAALAGEAPGTGTNAAIPSG